MRNVWGDAARWNAALHVEVAVAQAQAKRGDIQHARHGEPRTNCRA
jgi:adenylosuccinate lyase